jgi:hypothetical protein
MEGPSGRGLEKEGGVAEISSWIAERPPAKKQPEEGWSPPQVEQWC